MPCEDTGTFDNEVKTEISQDLGDKSSSISTKAKQTYWQEVYVKPLEILHLLQKQIK